MPCAVIESCDDRKDWTAWISLGASTRVFRDIALALAEHGGHKARCRYFFRLFLLSAGFGCSVVPQGAAESPLVFVMTSDCSLGSLQHVGLRRMLVGLSTRILVLCGFLVWLAQTMFLSSQILKSVSPLCSASTVWSLGTSVSCLLWTT